MCLGAGGGRRGDISLPVVLVIGVKCASKEEVVGGLSVERLYSALSPDKRPAANGRTSLGAKREADRAGE